MHPPRRALPHPAGPGARSVKLALAHGCSFAAPPTRQPSTLMRINFATTQDAQFWAVFEPLRAEQLTMKWGCSARKQCVSSYELYSNLLRRECLVRCLAGDLKAIAPPACAEAPD